jgi:DNA polymerase-3 subunit delta'
MAFTVDQAFALMEGAHERQRLAHAFLISGRRGSGKEALASKVIGMLQAGGSAGVDLFGEAVVPEARPLEEMAGEWVRILRPRSKSRRITVDEIRELEKSLHVVSGPNTWKVGVIIDADRMAAASENAFLKTLEEPPPRTLLLLLTENPAGLLPTVLSRCVRMPLMGGRLEVEGSSQVLLEALQSVSKLGLGSMSTALGLKACFAAVLAESKEQAEAAGKEALKEEEKALRQAVEGDWLKRREDELKAVATADYLNERAQLFDVMQSWLADVLRSKTESGGLEFPEFEASTRAVADMASLPELLRRMDAVEDLRRSLETNAQEQLALEVGFLRIFG